MALRPRPRERGTIAELRQGLLVALPEAGDTPGVVAAPWRSRRTTDDDHNHDHHHDPQSEREPEVAIAWADPDHGEPAEDEAGHKLRARATRLERVLGAGAAAALAAWAATHVLTPAPIAPAAVALVAAGAVLVAPRIGWLTLTAAFAALAAGQHHPGMAMLVLIAGLIAPLASPRRGAAWPLPSGAAALGAIGLATAWPALAARARTPWHRAGIAAAGWGWVVLLSAGAHTTARPAAVVWGASAYATWHDLLVPIVTSGALVTAAIWAGAAVLAPYLVRGRRIAVDAVRTVVWAAVLASATGMTHGATLRPGPAFGAVVAAAVILAPGLLGELRGREVLAGAKP
jgi:hypothetical protein